MKSLNKLLVQLIENNVGKGLVTSTVLKRIGKEIVIIDIYHTLENMCPSVRTYICSVNTNKKWTIQYLYVPPSTFQLDGSLCHSGSVSDGVTRLSIYKTPSGQYNGPVISFKKECGRWIMVHTDSI